MRRSSYEELTKYAMFRPKGKGLMGVAGKAVKTGVGVMAATAATSALNDYRANVKRIKQETPGAMISDYAAPALGKVDTNKASQEAKTLGMVAGAAKAIPLTVDLIKNASEENYLADLDCEVCGYSGKPHHTGACPNCGSPTGKERSHVRHDDYARSKDEPWSQNHEHFDAYNDDSWIW